nr:transposase [Tannerella forsythia]
MTRYKNRYRVETIRWQNWDYSDVGQYFITICINKRDKILGMVENGKMILSPYGEIVKSEILAIHTYFDNVDVDEWVIMPNHLHLIITIYDVETIHELSLHQQQQQIHELSLQRRQQHDKQYHIKRRQMLIPKIIGKFKMRTSKKMNEIRHTEGYKNWQSDYFDRVIRNEKEYYRIKQYIVNNPLNWYKDKLYTEKPNT